jgi:hypothetical protein
MVQEMRVKGVSLAQGGVGIAKMPGCGVQQGGAVRGGRPDPQAAEAAPAHAECAALSQPPLSAPSCLSGGHTPHS